MRRARGLLLRWNKNTASKMVLLSNSGSVTQSVSPPIDATSVLRDAESVVLLQDPSLVRYSHDNNDGVRQKGILGGLGRLQKGWGGQGIFSYAIRLQRAGQVKRLTGH